ncbi:MAG TPA: hypothetical protein VGL48_09125 [Acidimicrobiales bacterium]|jgi:hypothetical protein
MLGWLRLPLRFVALLLIGGAVVLVLWPPKANVASADLLTKVDVAVQCSSVWDQWTNHAQPAALTLNGSRLVSVPAAQSACQSASRKIKWAGGGAAGGAVVAVGLSFLLRRSPRR